jgi:hypothetical protein
VIRLPEEIAQGRSAAWLSTFEDRPALSDETWARMTRINLRVAFCSV